MSQEALLDKDTSEGRLILKRLKFPRTNNITKKRKAATGNTILLFDIFTILDKFAQNIDFTEKSYKINSDHTIGMYKQLNPDGGDYMTIPRNMSSFERVAYNSARQQSLLAFKRLNSPGRLPEHEQNLFTIQLQQAMNTLAKIEEDKKLTS